MRILVIAAAAAFAVATAWAQPAPDPPESASPFPAQRGTAPPPPAENRSQTAPPEGRAAGGVDFGQWRGADPTAYGRAFQLQMSQRYAGQTAAQIRSDLEANGFACENAQNLDCRIEITERECGVDWYVVVEPRGETPIAGYDRMCLGARRG